MKLSTHDFKITPDTFLAKARPDEPVYFFSPHTLCKKYAFFQDNFQGLTTYAVKANPSIEILQTLCDAGMKAFDVASIAEMETVRRICPSARLHYHNPLRSADEIAKAKDFGITSWSVDSPREFQKLGKLPKGTQIAVRLKLETEGGAYNFGEKFGADEATAVTLLKMVCDAGLVPAMTFHPGTQCENPAAWAQYIEACARTARLASVRLTHLNIGGGFPAFRGGTAPKLVEIFTQIHKTVNRAFGHNAPALICEPGRAMVADSVAVALRVKVMRDNGDLILNDGLYGALGEWRDISQLDERHFCVLSSEGYLKRGTLQNHTVLGPTCDSIDRLPFSVPLPETISEGDYILIQSMGAYSQALCTGFNGYGGGEVITCDKLSPLR